jgi:DNA-binding transcriptional MerR regulator
MSPLIPYQPDPEALYSLEWVASFSRIPRRQIVLYARQGLIHPALDPLVGGWYFDAAAIQTLRRIEQLRAMHRLDMLGIKLVLDLLREVEMLRTEVRFLRGA